MMQYVGEGFGVHQAMLDGHVHQFLGGVPGSKREGGIQRAAHARIVIAHFTFGGPVRGPIRWQIAGAGIYAEREQLVEAGMKCGHIESGAEQVPIERLQMAEIEDEAMPLRDGTLVQRGRIDQIEKAVGLLTRSIESLAQFRVRCHTGNYFSKRVWWGAGLQSCAGPPGPARRRAKLAVPTARKAPRGWWLVVKSRAVQRRGWGPPAGGGGRPPGGPGFLPPTTQPRGAVGGPPRAGRAGG